MTKEAANAENAIEMLRDSKVPSAITDTLSAINKNKNDAAKAVKASFESLENRLMEIY